METKKAVILGLGMLTLVVSGNIMANAIYARTKIDIDWKKVAIGGTIGLGVAIAIFKMAK